MVISHNDYYSILEIPNLMRYSGERNVPVHFHHTFFLKNTSENHEEFSKRHVKPQISACSQILA